MNQCQLDQLNSVCGLEMEGNGWNMSQLDADIPSYNLLTVTSFFYLDIFRIKFATRKGNDTILLKKLFPAFISFEI